MITCPLFPDPITWGHLQSLFQLSVAINIAFSVIRDVIGETPRKKQAEAHRLAERAREIHDNDLGYKISTLETQFSQKSFKIEARIFPIIGPICILFCILSLAMLCISVIKFNDIAHDFVILYSFIEFAPFCIGLFWIVYLFANMTVRLIPKLATYEDQVRKGEHKIHEKGNTNNAS